MDEEIKKLKSSKNDILKIIKEIKISSSLEMTLPFLEVLPTTKVYLVDVEDPKDDYELRKNTILRVQKELLF